MDLQWFTVRHTKSQPSSEPTDYGLITLDKSGLGGKTGVMFFCSAMFFPLKYLRQKSREGWVFFPPIGSQGRLGYIRSIILYRYTQTHKHTSVSWGKKELSKYKWH